MNTVSAVLARAVITNADAVMEELGAPRLYTSSTLLFSFRRRQLVALASRWTSFVAGLPKTDRNSFVWVERQFGPPSREIIQIPLPNDYEHWTKRKLAAAILAMQHLFLLILRDHGAKGAEYLLSRYGTSTLRIDEPGQEVAQPEAAAATERGGNSGADPGQDYLVKRIRELESQIESAARAAEALYAAEREMRELTLYLRGAYAEEIARGEHANQTMCQVLRRYLEKERAMAKASLLRRMWLALRLW